MSASLGPLMNSTLDRFRANVTSQHGEDGVLAYLLNAYPDISHTCLDVGASDGVSLSNTNSLWAKGDWRALLIDQNAAALKRNFGHLQNVSIVETCITVRGETSLDALAQSRGFPSEIGVASIDINTFEYWVFANLAYLKPAIAIIEFNPRFPPSIDYHDPEDVVFLRHSAAAMARLGAQRGYRAVACTGSNIFLVREAVIAANPDAVPDLPIEALFDHAYSRRFSKLFVYSQFIAPVPVYTRRPTPLIRIYGQTRYWWRLFHAWRRGKAYRTHGIPPAVRSHIESSGLWI
jgi:hypothetical protein